MKLILYLCLGLLALPPVLGMEQSCGLCIQNAVCSSSGTCTCDKSKGFLAGSRGDFICLCPDNHHLRYSDGKCAKNVGQTCSTSSECGDYNVCDTTCKCDVSKSFLPGSAGDTTCNCDLTKTVERNKMCLLTAGQTCAHTSDCIQTPGMICSGTCGCDTSKNYKAATAGATICTCADNYGDKIDGTCGKREGQNCTTDDNCVDHATCTSGTCKCEAPLSSNDEGLCRCTAPTLGLRSDYTCGKVIGQDCSNSSECIDYAACDGGKCKCDATLNRDATTRNGSIYCPCDDNSELLTLSGACYKTVGQPCNNVSECFPTTGMVCEDISGTKKCTCDTNNNYAAGSDGDTICHCATNYKEEYGTCVSVLKGAVGQACNASSADCIHGAVCDNKTSTCVCDTAKNYKAGTAGNTSCVCADYAAPRFFYGKRYCDIKVGGICRASTSTDECTAQNKSSNSEAGLFVSLTVLVTGLVMMLIPI